MEGLIKYLLGNVEVGILRRRYSKHRWVDAYFPFTNPSLEVEVMYNQKWMEVGICARSKFTS